MGAEVEKKEMFSVEDMVKDIASERPDFVAEWADLLARVEEAGRECRWSHWWDDWEDILCEADEFVSGPASEGVGYFYRDELLAVVQKVFETAAGVRR